MDLIDCMDRWLWVGVQRSQASRTLALRIILVLGTSCFLTLPIHPLLMCMPSTYLFYHPSWFHFRFTLLSWWRECFIPYQLIDSARNNDFVGSTIFSFRAGMNEPDQPDTLLDFVQTALLGYAFSFSCMPAQPLNTACLKPTGSPQLTASRSDGMEALHIELLAWPPSWQHSQADLESSHLLQYAGTTMTTATPLPSEPLLTTPFNQQQLDRWMECWMGWIRWLALRYGVENILE